MKEYVWIKDSGTVTEEDLLQTVKEKTTDGQLFLAFSTDHFLAGRAEGEELNRLKPENLLELRIFSEKQEVCFRRSFTGEDFQWRLASEKGIPESGFLVQYQTMDVNGKRSMNEKALAERNGNRVLYTTGGGKYSLPVKEDDNSVKVIAYIDYDRNGMAKITDHRLCGFLRRDAEIEKTGKGEERYE